MQQQWAAQQQQQTRRHHHQHTASMPSLQDLIAVHQKQWQEHLIMTGNSQNTNNQQTQSNHTIFSPPISPRSDDTISSNNTNYSQQYTMRQQQQYQQQENTSYSSRNLTIYQRASQQQQQQQQPQRRHCRHASMGHIKLNNNNAFNVNNNNNNNNNIINTQKITLQQHQNRKKNMHKHRQRASMGHIKLNINNNAFNANNNNNNNNNINTQQLILQQHRNRKNMHKHQHRASLGHLKINLNANNVYNNNINGQQIYSPHSPHSAASAHSPRLFQQQETRNIVNRNRLHSTGHVKMNNNYYNTNNVNNNNVNKQQILIQKQQQEEIGNDKNRFQGNRNRVGSTGQLKQNKNNNKKHKVYHSSNAIEQLEEKEEDEEECKDYQHETFIPPPPQNKQTADTNIIYESYLSKKGKINKSMKLRYCIADKDRKLKYFRKATDKNPAGYIDLAQVSSMNMYLPKLTKSKKNDIIDLNKLKNDGMCPLKIRSISLKGNKNNYGFELVTNKRVWTFSCFDSNIFKKWMQSLKDLCFGKSLHSGYLTKMGQKNKSWKRRFFVVYDLNEMRYFEDETMSIQKGKIDLKKVTKVLQSKPNKYPKYENCIELHTKERIWILASQTNQERDIWINLIANI